LFDHHGAAVPPQFQLNLDKANETSASMVSRDLTAGSFD
jgi:hypothetical protein